MFVLSDDDVEYVRQQIEYKLANLFNPKSRLDKFMARIIRDQIKSNVVPYFLEVITRHTEEEFHYKMANGFDIVQDMYMNHPKAYRAFISFAKKFGDRLNFNHNAIFITIIEIVKSHPYYWTITDEEGLKLYQMTLRLRDIIYS